MSNKILKGKTKEKIEKKHRKNERMVLSKLT